MQKVVGSSPIIRSQESPAVPRQVSPEAFARAWNEGATLGASAAPGSALQL